MTSPLLSTKLYIPPPRPPERVVRRPRLIQRLDEGLSLGRKLTLVSAPAGFGKTTLIAEWVYHSAREVAWISLDEGDNDPVQFLNYLIAALQGIDGQIGQSARQILLSPQRPPLQGLVTSLINDINAAAIPLLLILDDYHLIASDLVHTLLQLLLDRQPPSMHLVIGTRQDPPLSLPRLRARGQMTEVGERVLRFSVEEAAAFLNQVMNLELSAQDVTALRDRTEGWVTGLQLAALSAQGHSDVSAFVDAFTGSNRYVLDYLVEEVLRQQSSEVRRFLWHTSILDRMTAPLCDALTGQSDSQATLETLEESNLFIVPLDQNRTWYRYHRLFAEFMQSRPVRDASLAPEVEIDRSELHCRASQWYEHHGWLAEAIDHALKAPDLERAADLIEQVAHQSLIRGEAGALLNWLQALPQEKVDARPRLSLAKAWTLVVAGRPDDAETRVQRALQATPAHDVDIQGEAAAVRTLVAVLKGDLQGTIDLAQQALAYLSPDQGFLRGIIALNLGLAYDSSGQTRAAEEVYTQAQAIGQEAGNPLLSLMALAQLADLKALQGQLHQAAELCRQAIQLTAEPGKQLPASAMAHVSLARLLYEWNDLEAADRHLNTGIELARRWEVSDILVVCATRLARVRESQGDSAAAKDWLRQAGQFLQKPLVSPSTATVARAEQVQLGLKRGDLEAAARWADAYQAQSGQTSSYLRHIQTTTWARVLLAQGRPEPLADLLAPLLSQAQAAAQTSNVIEITLLQALALQAQGQMARAVSTLGPALALAEPEGYVRTFVDEGPPVARLLRQARARGVSPEYVSRLLAAFPSDSLSGAKAAPQPPSPLIEPLTPRELEVLGCLADGLGNKEIAQRLVIATGTVKQHLKHVYSKLDVHNRVEAVNRARELGLL